MGMLDLIRGKKAENDSSEAKALSEFQDPFARGNVRKVVIFIYNREIFHDNPSYAGQIEMSASVEFQKGATKGEVEIKAETFAGLVEKINALIKGMD